MKKILLIALALSLVSGMAIAQQKGGFGQSQGFKGNTGNYQSDNAQAGYRGNPVERLTEQLGLDEVQAETIAAIFDEMKLIREEERQRAREAADEARVNAHAQIMDVLTPEQQALFAEHQQRREELQQALEEMRQFRGEDGFGGGRGMGDCNR
jgi:Ni/Co efflux regulator RcnB